MKNNFSDTLKELRKKAGYTQKQVYEIVGVPQSTFSSWEIGKAEPSADMLLKLCQIYNVENVLTAFGYDGYNEDGTLQLNMYEIELVEKYRYIDDLGRDTIDHIITNEYKRKRQLEKQAESIITTDPVNEAPETYGDNVFFLETFTQTASAGTGQYLDDDATQSLGYPADRVPDGTDFAVPVSGDSMEPMLYDGDIIFIKRTDNLDYGDVGLFTANGEGLVKEYNEKGLVSLNKKYPIKTPTENDDFRIVGKVLGKL